MHDVKGTYALLFELPKPLEIQGCPAHLIAFPPETELDLGSLLNR